MSKGRFAFLLGLLFAGAAEARDPMDFDQLWNYEQPAATEAKFRALLPEAEKADAEFRLQLLTQIARTQSMQRKFPEAHEILDRVKAKLNAQTPVAEVRYLLERGRTYNSARKTEEALPLFRRALELGQARKLDFHAVDAAHMIAIAEKDPAKQLEWNLRAVEMAEKSKDPRAQGWLGSLYNNIGWTHHDAGRFEEALALFRKAQAFREKKGEAGTLRIAKWAVARALRSLKRHDEALVIQRALEAEHAAAGSKDGYVWEEIAELLLATGKRNEAKKYFGLAHAELSQDAYLAENEAPRLDRLKELSQ